MWTHGRRRSPGTAMLGSQVGRQLLGGTVGRTRPDRHSLGSRARTPDERFVSAVRSWQWGRCGGACTAEAGAPPARHVVATIPQAAARSPRTRADRRRVARAGTRRRAPALALRLTLETAGLAPQRPMPRPTAGRRRGDALRESSTPPGQPPPASGGRRGQARRGDASGSHRHRRDNRLPASGGGAEASRRRAGEVTTPPGTTPAAGGDAARDGRRGRLRLMSRHPCSEPPGVGGQAGDG
jgi:hypothetical protein